MKVVLAHICFGDQAETWHDAIAQAAPTPLKVETLPLTLPGRSGRISWEELDMRWRHRDRKLLELYRRVAAACEEADVLWNYNGAMLHPEFVHSLPCRTIYTSFDDPEDFPDLVAPVAYAYDYALYGNAASGPLFSEHFERSDWLPIFTDTGEFDHAVAPPNFDQRDIEIVFAGGISGYSDYRRKRLQHLADAFPQAVCVGRGWPRGYVERHEIESLYRRAKVGWNVHRTTGPINQRLFDLARFGVAQVCDNAQHLGRVFELGKEILSFGPIEEAVTQIQRLLDDDGLRRSMAVAARDRYQQNYTTRQIWNRFAELNDSRLSSVIARSKLGRIPSPAWLGYQSRARVERIGKALRSGCNAALTSFRRGPQYQTWSFDETACFSTHHDRLAPALQEVPKYVVEALSNTIEQNSTLSADSAVLGKYVREIWGGRYVTPPTSAPNHVSFCIDDWALPLAMLLETGGASSARCIVLGHGEQETFGNLIRQQILKVAGTSANKISFRQLIIPRAHVAWCEQFDDAHANKKLWGAVEVRLASSTT